MWVCFAAKGVVLSGAHAIWDAAELNASEADAVVCRQWRFDGWNIHENCQVFATCITLHQMICWHGARGHKPGYGTVLTEAGKDTLTS